MKTFSLVFCLIDQTKNEDEASKEHNETNQSLTRTFPLFMQLVVFEQT